MVKGTDQPCRINPSEPKPDTENIEKPEGLSEKAAVHWDIVVAQLQAVGVMTSLDVHALELYCESYARWREATEQIENYGMIVKSPSGYPVQTPYLGIANTALKHMKDLLVEFGMTPSSRTRVSTVTPDEPTDPWQKI
jgi:P27 family predicted phage terminase small subunit